MSQTRVSVERLFNEISFVLTKSQTKIGLIAASKIYSVCALLQNAGTCFMGIKFLSFPVYLLKARENEPTCSASSNMLDKKFWIRLRTMLDDFGPKHF